MHIQQVKLSALALRRRRRRLVSNLPPIEQVLRCTLVENALQRDHANTRAAAAAAVAPAPFGIDCALNAIRSGHLLALPAGQLALGAGLSPTFSPGLGPSPAASSPTGAAAKTAAEAASYRHDAC
jgi:hypothetical protein